MQNIIKIIAGSGKAVLAIAKTLKFRELYTHIIRKINPRLLTFDLVTQLVLLIFGKPENIIGKSKAYRWTAFAFAASSSIFLIFLSSNVLLNSFGWLWESFAPQVKYMFYSSDKLVLAAEAQKAANLEIIALVQKGTFLDTKEVVPPVEVKEAAGFNWRKWIGAIWLIYIFSVKIFNKPTFTEMIFGKEPDPEEIARFAANNVKAYLDKKLDHMLKDEKTGDLVKDLLLKNPDLVRNPQKFVELIEKGVVIVQKDGNSPLETFRLQEVILEEGKLPELRNLPLETVEGKEIIKLISGKTYTITKGTSAAPEILLGKKVEVMEAVTEVTNLEDLRKVEGINIGMPKDARPTPNQDYSKFKTLEDGTVI